MASLPNFEAHGYQVLETLNHNSLGGRITYKAIGSETETPVVIKQFRFVTKKDCDAEQQFRWEHNVLRGLDHSGIPRYIDTFDPGDGFCLVQEYKNAPNLAVSKSFSPEEIKDIAIQVLEILIYLQNCLIPIIHRDIKPENILFDEQLKKVYLVDFEFAQIGRVTDVLSGMIKGKTGFMSPEQLLNKPLTTASDFYGLGATIICLLTGKRSTKLSDLVNHEFRIDYKSLVTKYSLRFINWLDLMVEPDVKKRFANAEVALKSLQPLDIIRVPEIKLDKLELQFIASHIDEKLNQTITVSNESPDTILEGRWSVSPHPSDPPHTPDSHSWIRFSPKEFRGNQVKCNVTVDTSLLKADSNYEREIVLESNARQEKYYIKVKVKTAPFKNNIVIPPYLILAGIFFIFAILSGSLTQGWIWIRANSISVAVSKDLMSLIDDWAILGTYVGMIVMAIFGAIYWMFSAAGGMGGDMMVLIVCIALTGVMFGITVGMIFGAIAGAIYWAIGGRIYWVIGGLMVWLIYWKFNNNFTKRGYINRDTSIYINLTAAVGILTGIGSVIGFNSYILGALAATSLLLTGMLIYPPIKQQRLKAQYRRQESQNLIEP